ncbi:MAG: hypothetical protein J6569_02520 [Gilliamella sp.]|uniref:hypothetical protein n=1 Tax=Gilliamella TaxID=1193503 RepID=UPI00080EE5A1|nr:MULTISPECIES: hypothetical protein [Gilliamella]MCO6538380.1 hypothetical protein [Gilliamella sp.]MCO6538992.1 hypothetical protein [Gilliamella sp.]OCG34955.1 hypothetical protein A9G31_09130 [Gilliamella apicola]OCG65426.1 hypothetical protein A9G39_09700 [Gilliamella apicola]
MNLKYPLITTFSLLLFGCNNVDYKQSLQETLSREDNRALCYFLPNNQNIFPNDVFFDKQTEILDLFVDLKFLKIKNITAQFYDANTDITTLPRSPTKIEGLRYQLTNEGKKYFVGNKGAFCFGDIIIDKVNDTYNIEMIRGGFQVDTGKWIDYNYHYTNIPDWAYDQRFEQYYKKISLNSQILHSARATYYNSNNSYETGINKTKLITLKTKDEE